MSKKVIKYIVELFYIFIIPLILICATTTINHTYVYDDSGNFEISETTFNFDNSILKYTDGYKNVIDNFNINTENYAIGTINTNTGDNITYGDSVRTYMIGCSPSTTYYFYSLNNYSNITIYFYNGTTYISPVGISNNSSFTTPSNCTNMRFVLNPLSSIDDIKICINKYVSWANGNYVSYGHPLILYSDSDISGQDNINYTVWGNIKNSFEGALQLNDSPILNYVFCYVILWFVMFITWHLFYLLFDKLFHLRKE